MATHGRRPGSLIRCTCTKCGEVEMRPGCSSSFVCTNCRPHTLQQIAHLEVARAIRRGELTPASQCKCVDCGEPATGYDHRDYTKPLDVAPVCRSCNTRRGPAIGSRAMKRTTVYIRSATGITHGEFLACEIPA